MELHTILLYSTVAFFYILSPGPAVFLAIVNGLRADLKSVAIATLGNMIGLLFLSTVSILGLGAIIMASTTLFMVVKTIGALYLIYIGIKFIRANSTFKIDTQSGKLERVKTKKEYFKEAFLLAVTNPKPILFFTAIFPQFLNYKSEILPQFIAMTLIFTTLSFTVLFLYGFIAQKSKKMLSHPKRVTWFNRVSGAIFIALGISLLQLKRVE